MRLVMAKYPVPEPSMLELRGAIDLLRSALNNMPHDGWRGANYYVSTPAEKEARHTVEAAKSALHKDLSSMLKQSKEVMQAAALATIPVRSVPPVVFVFYESPFSRY